MSDSLWHLLLTILGASGDPFGRLGGAFGRPWAVCGVSCTLSGRIFGPSWTLLGPSWLYFDRFWSLQGHFGPLQALFRTLWGPILEPRGSNIHYLARTKTLQTINENLSFRTQQKRFKTNIPAINAIIQQDNNLIIHHQPGPGGMRGAIK